MLYSADNQLQLRPNIKVIPYTLAYHLWINQTCDHVAVTCFIIIIFILPASSMWLRNPNWPFNTNPNPLKWGTNGTEGVCRWVKLQENEKKDSICFLNIILETLTIPLIMLTILCLNGREKVVWLRVNFWVISKTHHKPNV